MAYQEKPLNRLREPDNSTIDKIIGITLDAPGRQRTIPLSTEQSIEIPKPYAKHDIKHKRTYLVGKTETRHQELSDAFKGHESDNTTYIEFYCEDENDTSPLIRAREFHSRVNMALNGMNIDIAQGYVSLKAPLTTLPSSKFAREDKHSQGTYITFCTNKDANYTVTPNIR